jgi:hypothetical protein
VGVLAAACALIPQLCRFCTHLSVSVQ